LAIAAIVPGGWNAEEMEDRGTVYETRALKMREQIEAMKEVWTKDVAEYHGQIVDFPPTEIWSKRRCPPTPARRGRMARSLPRGGRAMTTNITADHRAAFEALTSGDYANFALFSCFVNGEPAAAIVAINRDGDGYAITPLFVSVTPSLALTDHDGQPASEAPP
jgi:hypothetical protein